MSFFGELLEQIDEARANDLQAFIEAKDEVVEEKPPLGPTDVVRASSIWDFCARREAIRAKRQLTIRDKISARLSRIFRFGRVFERYLRNEVFGSTGLLVGKWECAVCGHVLAQGPDGEPLYPRPQIGCPHCLAKSGWNYSEQFKKDRMSGVGGHNDGFIVWNGQMAILEVKTANSWSYKSIVKNNTPMRAHIAQAQVYMHLHGLKRALVWYYNKDTSDQLSFWLDYDKDFAQSMLAKAKDFRKFFKTGELPERMCSDHRCPRAKECALRDVCFKEYP